ncbi:PREDICTED: uncharacterized protein LOC109184129 [Ipomoea nil]|uniref:uncharacterized protein LOC109184129 n=1 Tax=Ipomoea nil TaxID=35883 RepID=UPI000901D814|nr:PREDICTED: uncharacterized protein LOC109184129 [Ipomoea nil]
MRDHRDLRMLSTDAYEFEMKTRIEDERDERTSALMAEQPSTSISVRNSDFLSDEQFALFVRKVKKFMKRNNVKNSPQASSSRRLRKEPLAYNTNVCYNCRKPGNFMVECPYPNVSKYLNVSNPSQEEYESIEKRFKKGVSLG